MNVNSNKAYSNQLGEGSVELRDGMKALNGGVEVASVAKIGKARRKLTLCDSQLWVSGSSLSSEHSPPCCVLPPSCPQETRFSQSGPVEVPRQFPSSSGLHGHEA